LYRGTGRFCSILVTTLHSCNKVCYFFYHTTCAFFIWRCEHNRYTPSWKTSGSLYEPSQPSVKSSRFIRALPVQCLPIRALLMNPLLKAPPVIKLPLGNSRLIENRHKTQFLINLNYITNPKLHENQHALNLQN
ncbi:unnamed protein product, partial [Acanthoscelides obtectus]